MFTYGSVGSDKSYLNFQCLNLQDDIAWGFPKESPYLGVISHELNRIKEAGLIRKLIQKQVS